MEHETDTRGGRTAVLNLRRRTGGLRFSRFFGHRRGERRTHGDDNPSGILSSFFQQPSQHLEHFRWNFLDVPVLVVPPVDSGPDHEGFAYFGVHRASAGRNCRGIEVVLD